MFYSYKMITGFEAVHSGQVYCELSTYLAFLGEITPEAFVKERTLTELGGSEIIEIADNINRGSIPEDDVATIECIALQSHICDMRHLPNADVELWDDDEAVETSSFCFLLKNRETYLSMIDPAKTEAAIPATLFEDSNRYFVVLS